MTARLRPGWRALATPSPAVVLAALAVWVIAVTALHVGVNPGQTVTLTLVFERAGPITAPAVVR